mmetsp:Transcript_125993/g.314844  ORF Transcript_125993/g.314844 Transcript_125993/m.314844 type:complete len:200 (-) Transcript_125993:151-750(-)
MAAATSSLYRQSLHTIASKRSVSDGHWTALPLWRPLPQPLAPFASVAAAAKTSMVWVSKRPGKCCASAAASKRSRGSCSKSVATTEAPDANAQSDGKPAPQPISSSRNGVSPLLPAELCRREHKAITFSAATQAAGHTPRTPKQSFSAEIACSLAEPAAGCHITQYSSWSSSSDTTSAQILGRPPGTNGFGTTQTGVTR